MRSSLYLEQCLFYDQNSGTDLLFQDRTSRLFEQDEKASFVQIYVQSPPGHTAFNVFGIGLQYSGKLPKGNSSSDCSFNSQPSTPVDHSLYLRQNPPKHVELPGLDLLRIWNSNDLGEVALVGSVQFANPSTKLTHWECGGIKTPLSYLVCVPLFCMFQS